MAHRIPLISVLWRGFMASLPVTPRVARAYDFLASTTVRERYGNSLTSQFQSSTGISDPDWIWSTDWKRARPERRKHFKAVSRLLESGFFRPPERLQHLYYTHPYSHRPLVEFLFAIPANVLCGPGQQRRLMRRAFRELLPPKILERRSKGSYTGEFLKTLRPAAKRLLEDPRPLLVVERGYVADTDVRLRLQRMAQSLDCNEPQLRQIVLLELWLRGSHFDRRQASETDFRVCVAETMIGRR